MAEQHAVADFHAVAHEVACLVVAHAGPRNGRARRRQRIVHRALVRLGLHQPVRGCDCEPRRFEEERRLYIGWGSTRGPAEPPRYLPSDDFTSAGSTRGPARPPRYREIPLIEAGFVNKPPRVPPGLMSSTIASGGSLAATLRFSR